MFYAVEALLLTKELSASTHRGTNHLFSKNFIKTGIIDEEYYKAFILAFEKRGASDYDASYIIMSDEVEAMLVIWREFLSISRKYISDLDK